jgi:hypothetical protein
MAVSKHLIHSKFSGSKLRKGPWSRVLGRVPLSSQMRRVRRKGSVSLCLAGKYSSLGERGTNLIP